MRILTNGELVDFETPIFMTPEQQEEFLKEMEILFKDRLSKETIPEIKRGPIHVEHTRYKKEELPRLADIDNISDEELANDLGKSSNAISMKRGRVLKEMFEYFKKKDTIKDKESIERFIEEKYGSD